MSSIVIRDMQEDDYYFVGTCTHINESAIMDEYAKLRISWLRKGFDDGIRVKVALVDGERRGFLYVMPIEVCPTEPLGTGLMSIPCLAVSFQPSGSGIGRALVGAAEKEAQLQGKKGLATIGYYTAFWFMPGPFFEKCGFSIVDRQGERAIMWKVHDEEPKRPSFFQPNAELPLVPGKVVLDLFWMTFCGALDKEIVREVFQEFSDTAILREHCVDDRDILLRHQINRGLFVNGNRVEWNYESPKEGIRAAIAQAERVSLRQEGL